MSESAKRHAWSQTAEVLSMLFNGLFRPSTPSQAADFDPMAERPPEVVIEAPITALRMFVPQ